MVGPLTSKKKHLNLDIERMDSNKNRNYAALEQQQCYDEDEC